MTVGSWFHLEVVHFTDYPTAVEASELWEQDLLRP